MKSEKDILRQIKRNRQIYIYGAGMVGQLTYRWIETVRENNRIKGFIVTYMGDNPPEMNGVPVLEVANIERTNRDALVLVATLENAHAEITDTLIQYGFKNILPICDEVRLFMERKIQSSKEKVLYICATYYHVLISLTKILLQAQTADIVLSDGLKKNYHLGYRLLTSGCANNVYYYDNADVADGRLKSKFLKKISDRNIIKKFECKFMIDVKRYKDVYIFYDYNKIGRYLQALKCKYILLEDCYNFMSLVIPLKFKNLIDYWNSKTYKFDYFLNLEYQAFGQSKYCKQIEVNDKDGIVKTDRKVVEYPRKDLFNKLKDKDKEIIFKVFAGDIQLNFNSDNGLKTVLVLTQPLFKDNFVTSLQLQMKIYHEIIGNLSKDYNCIYLKPHPRDDFPYQKIPFDIKIIDKNIPTEVFNFLGKIIFDKAVTINSTAIYNMDFVKEKEVLGIEYINKFIKERSGK